MSSPPFTVIEEHPLPTTTMGARQLQNGNPAFDTDDEDYEYLSPDELRERHLTLHGKSHEWRVFTLSLYGAHDYVYCWNHMGGYGLRISRNRPNEFEHLALAITNTTTLEGEVNV